MDRFTAPATPSRPMPTFQPQMPGSPGFPPPMQPSMNYGFGTFGGSWMPWANNMIAMPAMTGLPVTSMTPAPMAPPTMPPMPAPMAPPKMPSMAAPMTPAQAMASAPAVGQRSTLNDVGAWGPLSQQVGHDLRQMGNQYGLPQLASMGRNVMHGMPQPVAQGDQGPRQLPPLPWANQPTAMDLYRQMQQQQRGPQHQSPAARFPRIMGMMNRFGR